MTDTPEKTDPVEESIKSEEVESGGVDPKAKKKLIAAVALLLIAGVLVAVLQILPAKYGIDLTGYGTYVGLTQLYKSQQYREKMQDTSFTQEQAKIKIGAGAEIEYKVYLLKGDPLAYSWQTDQGDVYSEFHGELKGGQGAILETYKKETGSADDGKFTAPFEGTHGWYWRNDNKTSVVITLDFQGKLNIVGEKAAAFSR